MAEPYLYSGEWEYVNLTCRRMKQPGGWWIKDSESVIHGDKFFAHHVEYRWVEDPNHDKFILK